MTYLLFHTSSVLDIPGLNVNFDGMETQPGTHHFLLSIRKFYHPPGCKTFKKEIKK